MKGRKVAMGSHEHKSKGQLAKDSRLLRAAGWQHGVRLNTCRSVTL